MPNDTELQDAFDVFRAFHPNGRNATGKEDNVLLRLIMGQAAEIADLRAQIAAQDRRAAQGEANGKALADMVKALSGRVESKPVDLAPIAASIEKMGQGLAASIDAGNRQVLQALASLEAATMADVKLVNGSGGRPTGTTKVKR